MPHAARRTPHSTGLAYVLYTSGSTGQPKGVMIPHRAVVNFLAAMQRLLAVNADDVLLAVTTLSFDIAGLEIFLPLTTGARVVLASREEAMDGHQLAALIPACGVTLMQATPATWRLMLESGWTGTQSLRILCGGEAFPEELAATLLERVGAVWNVYGPTETTIWSTGHRVQSLEVPVPIGRPLANTQVYILDAAMQPVPVGVAGELFIGGDGLARGYWKRPELTTERFVPNPFSSDPGSRLYRTGDQARYRSDGAIEYLGRGDRQVKLRGFRIELAEIEAVLARHPEVRQVTVVARTDSPGDPRLVAYGVPAPGRALAATELRQLARQHLPDYMVPALWVELAALPLTPNGKVDHRALPAPKGDRPDLREGYLAPRDALEAQLMPLWEQVLGIKPVGMRDNFFALGGHSLLAVRLFAQLEKTLGRRLPLATLFQAPTIEQLAHRLRQDGWQLPWSCLVAIKPGGTRPPLFLVHGLGGNVLNLHALAQQLDADQPVFGVQSLGLDGTHAPWTTIEAMAAHYLQELRAFRPQGPYHLGGLCFGALVAYEMARQLREQAQDVGFLGLLDAYPAGSDERLPAPERARLRREARARRIRAHWQDLRVLRLRDGPDYVRRKLSTLCRRIRSRLWQALHGLHPQPASDAARALLQDVTESNYLAARRYVTQPYPGSVTLFLVENQPAGEVAATIQAWQALALGGVDIQRVPGDHVNLLEPPHVAVLAEKLSQCLAGQLAHVQR